MDNSLRERSKSIDEEHESIGSVDSVHIIEEVLAEAFVKEQIEVIARADQKYEEESK